MTVTLLITTATCRGAARSTIYLTPTCYAYYPRAEHDVYWSTHTRYATHYAYGVIVTGIPLHRTLFCLPSSFLYHLLSAHLRYGRWAGKRRVAAYVVARAQEADAAKARGTVPSLYSALTVYLPLPSSVLPQANCPHYLLRVIACLVAP